MSAERWLPIPGYEGHYEVSDAGRVRSLERMVKHAKSGMQLVRGRVMRPPTDKHGYPRLVLHMDGELKSWAIHRAVMSAFVPRPDWMQMHVNHKDGVTSNNHLSNLEWCTASENRLHSYRVLHRRNSMAGRTGILSYQAVPVIGQCIATGEVKRYDFISDAQRDGFRRGDISSCLCGHQKSHKGWLWQYASEALKPLVYAPTKTESGGKNPAAKAIERVAPDGTVVRYEAASLAVSDGFTTVGISHCITGRQGSHRGYAWRIAGAGGRVWEAVA